MINICAGHFAFSAKQSVSSNTVRNKYNFRRTWCEQFVASSSLLLLLLLLLSYIVVFMNNGNASLEELEHKYGILMGEDYLQSP